MQTRYTRNSTLDWDSESTTRAVARRSERSMEAFAKDASRPIWEAILSIPAVREWRILRDFAFLLTSLPLGLAAFVVLVIGGSVGVSLSWLLIGIPILIWTVGLTLRLAMHERTRLHMLLDVAIDAPRYPVNNGENAIRHTWQLLKSPVVWKDLAYMMLLFPIGILELTIALLPASLVISPLQELAFGGWISSTVLGIGIDGAFLALVALGVGVALIFPALMLMNLTTRAHAALARKMLG